MQKRLNDFDARHAPALAALADGINLPLALLSVALESKRTARKASVLLFADDPLLSFRRPSPPENGFAGVLLATSADSLSRGRLVDLGG